MKIDLNKVLITGGNGSVASYLDFGFKTDRQVLDITNKEKVKEVVEKFQPQAILHLAAETDLKKCEDNPAHASLVNHVGTFNVALAAESVGATIVYVSTDAVFANSSNPHDIFDEPKPESVYGQSKYLGEIAVKETCSNFVIARTSWVFGGGKEKDKKFVAKFIAQLDKPEANAVNDEFNSPTYARDLAAALKGLILKNELGKFHIVNSGTASRYDMALVIAKTLQKDIKINPVLASTYGLLTYQKSSGGLISNVKLRPWQEALADYVRTEWM